ncbi:MAG TPA: redoxin domain-containing protein [Planctomycetes bacterium]|nr:redoxin domain-containing protein [Planctomycetota bacterium]HIK60956.1 redoxin domain-containing protein [Planctomycetota bacterium]
MLSKKRVQVYDRAVRSAIRFTGVSLLLLSLTGAHGTAPQVDLPPLQADKWLNWVGEDPTLKGLEGRAVMLHFFVCEEPKKSNWLGMIRFHREFVDRGLVILAVTPESDSAVKQLLDLYPLPFAIGTGSAMAGSWGMGTYGQILIDHQGEEFYRVDASNGVWNGKLRKSVNGSRPVGGAACLQITVSLEPLRGTKRAVQAMAKGELAKALGYLEAIQAKEEGELGAQAKMLADKTHEHLASVLKQIEESLSAGEAVLAQTALDALAKGLKRHPAGKPFLELAAKLKDDEAHQTELEAAKVYDNLVESFFRMGYGKNEKRFNTMVRDFPGTRNAEKMRNYWLGMLWR